MVDNARPSVLDRIGATTTQTSDLYLPVLMVTREKGEAIETIVADKEEQGITASMTVSKNRQVGVQWEEVRNFRRHCVEEKEGSENETEDKKKKRKDECKKTYGRLLKMIEGTEREPGIRQYASGADEMDAKEDL